MATLVSLQTSASSLVGNEPGRRGGIRLGVANVEALARHPMGMNQPPLGKPADEIAWRVGICGRRKERRQFAKRLTFEEIDRRANHSPASPRAREPASLRRAAPRRTAPRRATPRPDNRGWIEDPNLDSNAFDFSPPHTADEFRCGKG